MDQKELAILKERADADDPVALYTYSCAIRPTDPAAANKYVMLSAQLGYAPAAEVVGDMLMDKGEDAKAIYYYRLGAKAGVADCSVKLAVLSLNDNEHAALHDLEELAESGVMSACSALASYYKSKGNRKEYNFWRSLLKD